MFLMLNKRAHLRVVISESRLTKTCRAVRIDFVDSAARETVVNYYKCHCYSVLKAEKYSQSWEAKRSDTRIFFETLKLPSEAFYMMQ